EPPLYQSSALGQVNIDGQCYRCLCRLRRRRNVKIAGALGQIELRRQTRDHIVTLSRVDTPIAPIYKPSQLQKRERPGYHCLARIRSRKMVAASASQSKLSLAKSRPFVQRANHSNEYPLSFENIERLRIPR